MDVSKYSNNMKNKKYKQFQTKKNKNKSRNKNNYKRLSKKVNNRHRKLSKKQLSNNKKNRKLNRSKQNMKGGSQHGFNEPNLNELFNNYGLQFSRQYSIKRFIVKAYFQR